MGKRLDHIGIAVRSIEEALPLYGGVLGLRLEHVEEVPEQGVRAALLGLGETHIELLEPTGAGTPVGQFIATRGEGIHHVSVAVPDINAALKAAKAAGLRLIDERPRTGAGGKLVAFLHPRSTGGVLIELSQEARHDDGR